jgi:hypothetical protein
MNTLLSNFYTFTLTSIPAFILGILMILTLLVLGFHIIDSLRYSWVRLMRYLAIRKAGWPPYTCDADGDPVTPKET